MRARRLAPLLRAALLLLAALLLPPGARATPPPREAAAEALSTPSLYAEVLRRIAARQASAESAVGARWLYGVSGTSAEESAGFTALLVRAARESPAAALHAGLFLTGLPRLASFRAAAVFSPFVLPALPPEDGAPNDFTRGLGLLRGLATDPGATPAEQARARRGLAQLAAAFAEALPAPDLPATDLPARLRRLLDGLPQPALEAAVMLTGAGRCAEAAAFHAALPPAAAALLAAACAVPRPVLPHSCRNDLDPGDEMVPARPPASLDPLAATELRGPAAAEKAEAATACLWRGLAAADLTSPDLPPHLPPPSGAGPTPAPSPEAPRRDRLRAAATATGWPLTPEEARFMAAAGTALLTAEPEEGARLLARSTPEGRLRAARLAAEGTVIPADPAAARRIVASAAAMWGGYLPAILQAARWEFAALGYR